MLPYTLEDAETDLRTAIDQGDSVAITALAATIDALDVPTAVSLEEAALYYASVGLHVFPLSPGTKIPFKGTGGFRDATTDPAQIRSWWSGGNLRANIGIATGHLIDVVDIDGHEGQRSRVREWEARFEQIDADALAKILTPRAGGMHIYVAAQGGGNHAGLCPGIDYRGVGGYVVAPPSVTPQGSYRFLGLPTLTGLAERVS